MLGVALEFEWHLVKFLQGIFCFWHFSLAESESAQFSHT